MHPMTQKTARKAVHTTISLTGIATTLAMLMHVTTTGEIARCALTTARTITLETDTVTHLAMWKSAIEMVETVLIAVKDVMMTDSETESVTQRATLQTVTTTGETAICALIGVRIIMSVTIIVTVHVTFLTATEMTETANCAITTALIHTWVTTDVTMRVMWNPATEITATVILTTKKVKNWFYAPAGVLIITSEMAFATMLVTSGNATMMTVTALKNPLLTTQLIPAALLTPTVVMTSKPQTTFSNLLINRISRKARNSGFGLSWRTLPKECLQTLPMGLPFE